MLLRFQNLGSTRGPPWCSFFPSSYSARRSPAPSRKKSVDVLATCESSAIWKFYPQLPGGNLVQLSEVGRSLFCEGSSGLAATSSITASLRSAHTIRATTHARSSEGGVASVASLLPHDAARGEQQALQSLLQEIETYTSCSSNTKLSLKVFHLQQLAMIRGCAYLPLQQHAGVASLISDLTAAAVATAPAGRGAYSDAEHAAELSPQQLHTLVLCCCKLRLPGTHPLWRGAAKQLLRHTKRGGLSASETCSSLRCLAAAAVDLDRSYLASLMEHVLRNVAELNEYDAACILHAVRRYRFKPRAEAEQHVQILQGEAPGGSSARQGKASAISKASNSSLSKNNNRKHSSRSNNRSNTNVDELSLKVVRVCAWVLERRAAAATPKSLVCCLYEFGLLQLLPWRFLLLLRRRFKQQQQLQQLDAQGLALLALSLALLQQRDAKIMKKIGTVLQQRQQLMYGHLKHIQERQQPVLNQSLCLLLHAIAKLGIREKNILDAFCERIERAGDSFSIIQVAMSSHALGRLGVRHAGAWRSINRAFTLRSHQFSPLNLSLGLQGAAKAAEVESEAVQALLTQAMNLKRSFSSQQLVNFLDGLATSGHVREHSQACLSLLEVYVQLGEEGNGCRENQLRRIAFTLLMESPEAIMAAPRSLQVFIDSKQQPFQSLEPQDYHQALAKALRRLLGVNGSGPNCVGPYSVDIRLSAKEVEGPLSQLLQQGQQHCTGKKISIAADICLDLLSEGCYCPLSGRLLGAALLKQRQLQQLGVLYTTLRRRDWLRAAAAKQHDLLLGALLHVVG